MGNESRGPAKGAGHPLGVLSVLSWLGFAVCLLLCERNPHIVTPGVELLDDPPSLGKRLRRAKHLGIRVSEESHLALFRELFAREGTQEIGSKAGADTCQPPVPPDPTAPVLRGPPEAKCVFAPEDPFVVGRDQNAAADGRPAPLMAEESLSR